MFRCSGVGKRYGDRWLFRHLSVDVPVGDCLLVLGHNGSGKSTFLKIVAGLLPPTEGSCERPMAFGAEIGYAALDQAVYPVLTVREHLILAGSLRGCADRADELLDEVGLAHAAEAPGRVLSTGMRARLKLALAVQAGPRLILLDEPAAGLDEPGKEMMRGLVERRLGTAAFIIATNDPFERRFATLELELGS